MERHDFESDSNAMYILKKFTILSPQNISVQLL